MCNNNGRVSPVLMIRSVPSGTTQKDLHNFGARYHYIVDGERMPTAAVKVLVVQKKHLAFVQMGSREEARAIMQLYEHNRNSIYIERDGVAIPVSLQYSDKDEIKAVSRAKNQVSSAEEGCRVLLVVLANLRANLQLAEVFWIFSQFGEVEKLSHFQRDNKNQVLVQMACREQANLAMSYLNGKSVPFFGPKGPSHCQYSIVPSKLPYLTFKKADTQNRNYSQQNALLKGDWMSACEPLEKCPDWPRELPNYSLKDRIAVIKEHEGFFTQHKQFVWGQDITGTGKGKLVPCQEHEDQYGTIPQPVERPGIPAGKVGDCVHVSHIGTTNAQQLWALMGVYGNVVAAKLLWKYQGTAVVQFSNRNEAQAAIKALNGVVGLNGEKWVLKEGNNPNAMHWSGAKTELDQRMVSILSAQAPFVHPTQEPTVPEQHLLFFSSTSQGFVANMAGAILDLLTMDNNIRPDCMPQQRAEADGRVSYVVTTPSVFDAMSIVARLNGTEAARWRSLAGWAHLNGHSLDGVQVCATFISQAEAERAYMHEDHEDFGMDRATTFATFQDPGLELMPRSGTDPAFDLMPRSETM